MRKILSSLLDLSDRALWLCQIRWFALVGVFAVSTIAKYGLLLQINIEVVYIVSALMVICNLFFLLYFKFGKATTSSTFNAKRNINLQIVLDYIYLTIWLHFTGGIENPFIVFYVFHFIVSSLLLSKKNTIIQATFGIFLFCSLTFSEYMGYLHHYQINQYIGSLIKNDPYYLFSAVVIFIAASYVVIYLSISMVVKMRIIKTKLSEAITELNSKDEIKNEYMKRVTHDIKGHLAAILSNISIIHEEVLAPIDEKNKEFLHTAHHRTLDLIEFVNELQRLTVLRLNNNVEVDYFSLTQALTNAVKSVESFAKENKSVINSYIADEIPDCRGTKLAFEEAISNLLFNAVKYSPAESSILLTSYVSDHIVNIIVEDNGYGIPAEEQAFIFDEFYRASNVKKIKEGDGMGLALVKTIIERHHGTITVESELNKGSKFIIKLPLQERS